jgi:carotenoid cleavage dioxygenase-like enzyme
MSAQFAAMRGREEHGGRLLICPRHAEVDKQIRLFSVEYYALFHLAAFNDKIEDDGSIIA